MFSYLSEEDQKKADRIKELYYKCCQDNINCTHEMNKEFYRGKAYAVNEILIMLFNIDMLDE